MTYREDRKGDIRLISIDRPPLHLLDREAIEALSDAFARHPKSAPLVLRPLSNETPMKFTFQF